MYNMYNSSSSAMLNRESNFFQNGTVVIMSEIAIIAASMRSTLQEIAKQAATLGVGLQNAAPGDKSCSPNEAVQYLLATSDALNKLVEDCERFLPSSQLGQDN